MNTQIKTKQCDITTVHVGSHIRIHLGPNSIYGHSWNNTEGVITRIRSTDENRFDLEFRVTKGLNTEQESYIKSQTPVPLSNIPIHCNENWCVFHILKEWDL